MFLRKSTPKIYRKKLKLDQILWFVENYLPQKKDQAKRKKFLINDLKAETINPIQKFASLGFKLKTPSAINTKISLTFGSWASPYLKFFKQIGLAK